VVPDTTAGATREAGEPNHAGNPGGHSKWFTWTAPGPGQMTIHARSTDFDTLLAVYTGTSVGALTTVVANDDMDGSTDSQVGWKVVAGTTYVIAVDGVAGGTGAFTLDWTFVPYPNN
jgi:hypothetical protein